MHMGVIESILLESTITTIQWKRVALATLFDYNYINLGVSKRKNMVAMI